MKVEVVSTLPKLSESRVPTFATELAAAVDLRAAECVTINPDRVFKMGTGVSIAMPEGMAAVILPRSSTGTNGLWLANTVGLIDPDYRGQIFLALWNRSDKPIKILEGDRVAQMMFLPFIRPELCLVDKFTTETARGAGGFGSTGDK